MLRHAISTVIPPLVEPVSVDEVKAYGRIDGGDEDELITGWIATAREAAELFTGRSFIARTLRVALDAVGGRGEWTPGYYQLPVDFFDAAIPSNYALPRGPILSIESVTTYDTLNAASVYLASNYRLAGNRIALNPGSSWPSGVRTLGGTEITYTAGYGPTPADVPRPIRTALAIHAAALYETRGLCECDLPAACRSLLQPYRVMLG